jgi:hypothetical protein
MAVGSRIFISYRRDDSPAYAGRLFDQLSARFGPSQVFMDVDTLEPGVDFIQMIEESVSSVDVLIAVIGRSWANAVDESGRRRLDAPEDFVRLEVGGALRRNIRVIPVLVGGAKMPTAAELPEDLVGLLRRNGLEIPDLDWRSGTERLFVAIDHVLGTQQTTPEPPVPVPDPAPALSSAVLPVALTGAALLTVGLFLRWDSGGHSFLHNNFGGNVPHGGVFTSLAPIGIVVAVVLGALLARQQGTRAVGVGILVGAGIAGVVKYLRILQAGHYQSTGVTLGVLVALVGGILVLAAGFLALRATTDVESARNPGAAILGIAGAAVMIVATAIPFNGGGGSGEAQKVARSFDEAFDPIVTSLAIAAIAALLLGRSRHAELSAALLTLGVLDALLWIRYFGIPLVEDSSIASFAAGGLVGLAGAGLVLVGGYLGLRGWRQRAAAVATAET